MIDQFFSWVRKDEMCIDKNKIKVRLDQQTSAVHIGILGGHTQLWLVQTLITAWASTNAGMSPLRIETMKFSMTTTG